MRLKHVSLKVHSAYPANPQSPNYGSLCEQYPGDLIQTLPYAESGEIVLVVDKKAGTRTFGALTRCMSKAWGLWCWENLSDEALVRKFSDHIWQEVDHPGGAEAFLRAIGVDVDVESREVNHV